MSEHYKDLEYPYQPKGDSMKVKVSSSLRKDRTGFKAEDGTWYSTADKSVLPDLEGAKGGGEVEFDETVKESNGRTYHNILPGTFKVISKGQPYNPGGNKGGGKSYDSDGSAKGCANHCASRIVAASIAAGKLDPKNALAAMTKLSPAIYAIYNGKPAPAQTEAAPSTKSSLSPSAQYCVDNNEVDMPF